MSGTLALALAEVPSAKLAISVKPAPLPNTVGFRSDANTKNAPPSATPKLTVPAPVLSSAPSRLTEAPRAQCAVAGSVSQTPPPPARRSSSRVTVRAPLPAWMVTRKLPSSAPSALKAVLPCPTLSRSLPRNARLSVGGGGVTVKPPVSTADCPSGFVTVTSRAPIAAVAPITRATESWVDETTVVELTVMPAPNAALAPAWKLVPVTVTVRFAPCSPVLGDTLEIVGMNGTLALALAEAPSAKLAVSVKLAPLVNTELGSAANTKNVPPSVTPKLTVPVPALSSPPSRLPAAPRAQCAVAGSVSQTPPPPARLSSSRVTVRAPLPAWRVTRKLPSSAPSTLKAVLPCPTLSRSLPRNARPSVGGGGATAKPPASTTVCPFGFVTVTSRAPIAAVAPITRATESWVDETTVVELTVMPAPNAALAPAWKFVPVTVTVRFAPCSPVLGDTLEIVGMSTLALALAEVPSAKLAISVKPAPLPNTVGFRSEANTKNAPPSATPKLTVPVPELSSAPSRLPAAPRAQFAVAGSVSQTPPPPARLSSSRVTVRAPLPAWTVTRKLPSNALSALKAVLPCPTLSRSLPRNARPSVGGGGVTAKPPASTTVCPSGFVTVTSLAPIAAVAPITRATESWVDETTVVDVTVIPAPNAALAPAWKLVPVTVTVRFAPCSPVLGDTLEIVGTFGRIEVAVAEVPSAKLAVSVKLTPLVNTELGSAANTKNVPPSATPKLTVPVPALSSPPSRLPAAPRAQCAVAGSVSQTPPLLRSSSRVTVRAPLPAWTVTRKLPSSAPSTLKAVLPRPTLSRSLPRNARPSVGGSGRTVKPPTRVAVCPPGFVTVTSRGPGFAVAAMARATESWVDETTVIDVTVMSAPNEAVAPGWKLIPLTVTVRLVPSVPRLGETPAMIGTPGLRRALSARST